MDNCLRLLPCLSWIFRHLPGQNERTGFGKNKDIKWIDIKEISDWELGDDKDIKWREREREREIEIRPENVFHSLHCIYSLCLPQWRNMKMFFRKLPAEKPFDIMGIIPWKFMVLLYKNIFILFQVKFSFDHNNRRGQSIWSLKCTLYDFALSAKRQFGDISRPLRSREGEI